MTNPQYEFDADQLSHPFLREMAWRGFIHQFTDLTGLDDYLNNAATPRAYIGFDPTADSLHVGNLVPIRMLQIAQKHGVQPIVLMGGATGLIGDPSGKTETRQMLSEADIRSNIDALRDIMERFIDFAGPKDQKEDGRKAAELGAILVNNMDWMGDMGLIEFLRDVGPHMSINRMLSFESVKSRLDREQHLSFLEFNYMLFQGYDFVHLLDHFDCRIQMGGSDQWGNIINGVELVRRMRGETAHALTAELITTADGKKMGKTADGAVWLTSDRVSPYDYYQYWRNVDDRDVIRFAKIFTNLDQDTINDMAQLQGREINEAKQTLAYGATKLVHGERAADQADQAAKETFSSDAGVSDDLPGMSITGAQVNDGIQYADLFNQLDLTDSKSEARRLINQGGLYVNDEPINDKFATVSPDDYNNEKGQIKLSRGKKKHALVSVDMT